MPCQWEEDQNSKKGTLHVKKGGQYTTTKTISGMTCYFDSGGELVRADIPDVTATVNLTALPFKAGSTDLADARLVLGNHRRKTN